MRDLYIIAAGKGSRMNSDIPKALMKIGNEINVLRTIRIAEPHFDRIIVVAHSSVKEHWEKLNLSSNTIIKYLDTMYGDGDAVLESLEEDTKFATIIWGDAVLLNDFYFNILNEIDIEFGIIPVVYDEAPYVKICVNENEKVSSALFSKYNEVDGPGYHDQCIFTFGADILKFALKVLKHALWKENKYMTTGGELSLLHTFHYLYNTNYHLDILQFDKEIVKSYNTKEELEKIVNEINF